MKAVRLTFGLVLITFFACALAAQGKPDFSGRWIPVAPADVAPDPRQEIVVKQDQSTLTIEHPSERGTHSLRYTLDGNESRQTLHGVDTVSKASWEGNKLVIDSISTYSVHQPGATRTVKSKQVWSLNSDGMLIIETAEATSGGSLSTMKATYKKR